jgi:AcrR family transcriptional regulator
MAMGRAALTADDHAAFRAAMRGVATRRFAKLGEAGVTMRGLADDLGCSAMTPYRYFRDKDEIFAMVRVAAIEAFADAQERAYATEVDPVRRLHALGRAYVAYALAHPDQYRVMFQLERRGDRKRAEPAEAAMRGWLPMRNTIAEAVAAGAMRGDPDEIAHVSWSALHGLVTLHFAGKLRLGRALDSLVEPTIDLLLAGARAQRKTRRRRRR